jgi:hypothetical protein
MNGKMSVFVIPGDFSLKSVEEFIQKATRDAAAHRARCPRRATDDMSAFTVSAVAAPGAAKFASRNANARRPAAAPARVVRRAGRVAQRVVAKAGPSGEVKKVRATRDRGTPRFDRRRLDRRRDVHLV